MNETLIRVRDFAQRCGCTPQNIYGHLKTYAAELEGHTHQGRGRQGIYLDPYACEFLRSVMYPKEVTDNALMDEINQLRQELMQAGMEITKLSTKLVNVEAERDRALLDAGNFHKQLKAAREEEEAKQQELDQIQSELGDTKQALDMKTKQADSLNKLLGETREERDDALRQMDREVAERREWEDKSYLLEQQLAAEKQRSISLKEWWRRRRSKG